MKFLHNFTFMVCVFCGTLMAEGQSNKRALVVAVADYDPNVTGWNSIRSKKDARILKSTLTKQGFDVTTVINPTKEEILNSLRNMESVCRSGDIVIVHISAHGVQISDDNGDERDGYDEAIVPIDAPSNIRKPVGYTGQRHLRDDELGESLTRIRKKIGASGDLLVLLDACHSGTATRGDRTGSRGDDGPLELSQTVSSKRHIQDDDVFFSMAVGDELSNVTVISASQANKKNYENQTADLGSLTSSVCSIWERYGSKMTYTSFFARIQSEIASIKVCYLSGQQPEMESTQPDRGLFGGQFVNASKLFSLLRISPDGKTAVINGGKLRGLDIKAEVKIFEAGEDPISSFPSAIGLVDSSSALQAVVSFTKPLMTKREKSYVATLDRTIFHDDTLFVDISSLPRDQLVNFEKARRDKILNFPMALTKGNSDVSVNFNNVRTGKSNFLVFINSTNHKFNRELIGFDEMFQALESLYWFKVLSRINLNQQDIDVSWSFNVCNSDDTTSLTRVKGKLNAKVGSKPIYCLEIENHSDRSIYFNIIDFQPDGIFNILWPKPSTVPEGLRLMPQEVRTLRMELSDPYGEEVLKMFFATEHLDMRPLLYGIPRNSANIKSPIMKLMFERVSVRSSVPSIVANEGKTYDIRLVVSP